MPHVGDWHSRTGRRAALVAIAAAAGFLAQACLSPMTELEVKAKLQNAADSIDGLSRKPRIVVIHAETRMAAWTLLTEARGDPDSPRSRQLGASFARGRRYKIDFVIGGPYASLTDQLVLNALRQSKGRTLPGLRLYMVTPSPPSKALRETAAAARVRLLHRPLR